MFIAFEAGEGAGKSTQSRRLAEDLKSAGYDVIHTREPGGSPGAEDIRRLILEGDTQRWSSTTELLLFMAARRDHVERIIEPALAAGKIVICDRYIGSTVALQGAAGGVSRDTIMALHDMLIDRDPDLTIFLDIDPEVGLDRAGALLTAQGSAEGRFEAKGLDYHKAVDRGFRHELEANETWVSVDANGTPEEVFVRVNNVVLSALSKETRKIA